MALPINLEEKKEKLFFFFQGEKRLKIVSVNRCNYSIFIFFLWIKENHNKIEKKKIN